MSLLIKNGEIITATSRLKADVYCEGDTITQIGTNLQASQGARVLDATGKYVFPGFIDPHVHIYLPFMGTYAKDTWETAGKAALLGGTTTLIEMVCPSKGETPLDALKLWLSKADGLAPLDYSFHMGVSTFDEQTRSQLKSIVEDYGIASFKVFMAYKGALGIDDAELYNILALAKELGVIVTAHCENADLIASLQNKLVSEGKTGPEWHEPSRPVQVEAEGCHHLMTFAELTGAAVYVVHTSCHEAVQHVLAAKERGVRAWLETVIPYLILDDSYATKSGFEGAKYVMSPPIRTKRQQEYLWDYLRSGDIATVATDHAPFDFATQKHMGHPDPQKCLNADFFSSGKPGDFTFIPNGIPSVEERVKLLYTYGVCEGRIDLHKLVDCASTQAAKIFGLHPRKGEIAVGADADLVVFDPEYTGVISQATHHMATDYSGFEGLPIKGRAEFVTVRGQVAVDQGNYTGLPGRGRLLKRVPSYF